MERPNGERHAVTDADIRRTLCGLNIVGEIWRDDGQGKLATCRACLLHMERDPDVSDADRLGPWMVGCCDRDQGHSYYPNVDWTEAEARASYGDR